MPHPSFTWICHWRHVTYLRTALWHGFRRVFTQKAGYGPPQKRRNELQKSQEKTRLFMVFCTVHGLH